jgi:hypothetical protein
MIAVNTSPSSGETSRSRCASVLEGATCSIGTTSPVVGRAQATKLWWVSSNNPPRVPVLVSAACSS